MKKVCFAINLYNHQGNKDTRIQFHPRKARLGIEGINARQTSFPFIPFVLFSLMGVTGEEGKCFVNQVDNLKTL